MKLSVGQEVALLVWLFTPFAQLLAWASILATAFYPAHLRLRGLVGGRETLAATLSTLLVILVALGPELALIFRLTRDYEAAEELLERLKDIPIIMVTAKNDLANLQEAFSAGAMDYIAKPVTGVELHARVTSALTLKREMDHRKAREAELRRSNDELQKALKEVKTLRGLIPICASCKKIRDDAGYWQRIEDHRAGRVRGGCAHSAGKMSDEDLHAIECVACPSGGSCGGQFTANTMACVSEALGIALPGSAGAPAPYESRDAFCEASGEQVMKLIKLGLRPRDIVTRKSLENAAMVVAASGGSTNAGLHLPAIAHEAGIEFDLNDVCGIFRKTPYIADLKPGGRYVANDLYEVGGVRIIRSKTGRYTRLMNR